jgi:hypothetical protein
VRLNGHAQLTGLWVAGHDRVGVRRPSERRRAVVARRSRTRGNAQEHGGQDAQLFVPVRRKPNANHGLLQFGAPWYTAGIDPTDFSDRRQLTPVLDANLAINPST